MKSRTQTPFKTAGKRSAFVAGFVCAMVFSQSALAEDVNPEKRNSGNFELDSVLIDTMQFSRVQEADLHLLDEYDLRTEVSFKLRPSLPNFSREGAFGLNMFGRPEMEVLQSTRRDLFFGQALPDLHEGFSYSAGVRIEHNEESSLNSTSFVSSSLLGVSYGRIGKVWYGGVDVNLEQFADEFDGSEREDVVSLDFTTGRRLGFTGLEATSPLWLLSLQGNFDLHDEGSVDEDVEGGGDWYLNPSLFWQRPGFTFSAQVQLPVTEEIQDNETPDYRLRAIFEKQF